jgi:ATP-dependent helicase HrpB
MKDSTLPVLSEKNRFIEAIENGNNVVFTAPTGSGKSTCLPLWLFQLLKGPVLVIEPRRVACRSLATYVAEQSGESVGKTVGYRIRFDDCTTGDTRIFYVTPGVAIKMLKEFTDTFCALVIDEFHERRWECDLIAAGFLAEQQNKGTKSIPLVITSATLDGGELATKVGAIHIDGKGSLFPVDLSYDESMMSPSSSDLDLRVHNGVLKALEDESDRGDILVFLPGMGEINDCFTILTSHRISDYADIHVLHSSVDVSKMSRMLTAHVGKRRIFLSTNIAETSLTIPGVTTVIDSGLVRIKCHRAGRSGLVVAPICEDSMVQRSGRAGRVQRGRALRLWSQTFKGEPETAPEVERVYLDDMLLSALSLGVNVDDVRNLNWITRPLDFAFQKSVDTLKRIGAVTDEGTITALGRRIYSLPLPVELARLIIDVPMELAAYMADLVALLSTGSNFLLPLTDLSPLRQAEVENWRKKLFDNCFDEVSMKITCLRSGDLKTHHLAPFALNMTRKTAAELRAFTGCKGNTPKGAESPLIPGEQVAAYILKIWPEAGFVLRKRAVHKRQEYRGKGCPLPFQSEPWSNGDTELMCRPSPRWGHKSSSGKTSKLPIGGLILEHEWVGRSGTSVSGYGKMILPCSLKTFAEAGCGEEEISELILDKDGRVKGLVVTNYGGVVIERSERFLYGSSLIRAVAQLALDGRLFEGLSGALEKSLFYIHLALIWPGGFGKSNALCVSNETGRDFSNTSEFSEEMERAAAVSGISPYIEYRLCELGLKKPDDIFLLDKNCFAPSVKKLSGLSFDELSDLKNDFPSRWSYSGKEFDVQVSPLEKRVFLIPLNKEARNTTELPHLVIPLFSGFSVFIKKGTGLRRVR